MTTPLTVDQELFVPYLINSVLFDRVVTIDDVKDTLIAIESPELTIGEFKDLPETDKTGPGILFGVNGQYLMRVIVVDSPLTDQIAPAIHPILTGPVADKLSSVQGQALVSIHPNEGTSNREDRFAQAWLHALVSHQLAQLAGIVGIHNVQDSTTVDPDIFADAIEKKIYPVLMAPVWLAPDEGADTFTGYTYGLHQLGHPELQATGISGDPTDAYLHLMNLTHYVLGGATLKDGDTFGFGDNADPSKVTADTWVINDKVPALKVQLPS